MRYKTIKELCRLEKGDTGITKAIPGKYPLVTTNENRKSHNDFQLDTKAVIIPLVSSTGHGHASLKRIHYQEGKFALGSILCALIPKDENLISAEFLYHYLNLNKEKELVSRMKGMANVTLSISEIGKIKIPVITLDRQIKIISLLKNVGLTIEILNSEFEKQINFIKKLRQQILKDAIQGKLVSRNFDDEPASELFRKIKAEKERLIKEKKLKDGNLTKRTIIKRNNIYPQNWEECKLNDLFFVTKLAGFEYTKYISLKDNEEIPVVRAQNVKPFYIDKSNLKYIDRDTSLLLDRCALTKECLLITFIGAGIGDVATFKESKRWHLAPNVAKAECFDNCESLLEIKFFNYFLLSEIGRIQIFKHIKATAQPSLSMSTIRDIDLPLPPIAEQQRIVKRVDELMDLCYKLEESIIRNQEITERFYQSVLKEALQPKGTKKITLLPNYCDVPKRTILAGYILNQCHTEDFGRVKFMKLLYLVEHICYLDFNSQYIKKAAGPYDENLIKEIEQKLSQMQFYQIQQDKKDNKRVHYTRLGCADELDNLFTANFVNEKEAVNELLTKFKHSTWDQCEIIATLYAVWNNRIIQNELINDALLKQDFLDWDKNKVKYKDRLDAALDWMRNNSIIPNGYGKLIEKP